LLVADVTAQEHFETAAISALGKLKA